MTCFRFPKSPATLLVLPEPQDADFFQNQQLSCQSRALPDPRRTARPTLSSMSMGDSNRALRVRQTVVRCACRFFTTQVLRREDLINSKGKPLVTAARLEAVWKRLSDRFATVVADTSMITMSTEYAAHFHDIYIDGKEHAKMTGDRMKILMLTLPFMVRDLIAPEVVLCWYILVYTSTY